MAAIMMKAKDEKMTHLFTPPINSSKFDPSLSIKESYKGHSAQGSIASNISSTGSSNSELGKDDSKGSKSPKLSKEEIDQISQIGELPDELSAMIDAFIDDLKQPKYERPLSVPQLSSLFQAFYIRFDKHSFHYLQSKKTTSSSTNVSTFFNARETLTSGIGGLFSRSRSSSASTNVSTRRNRRSSSIFSNESGSNNVTQMLSPEEIQRQLKTDALNNLKIEKYKDLCERDLFNRILQVGTSVPISSPSKSANVNGNSTSANSTMTRDVHAKKNESFSIVSLFRNSPEFGEYDKLIDERVNLLYRFDKEEFFSLSDFLDIPKGNDEFDSIQSIANIKMVLDDFANNVIAPGEKCKCLLKMYEIMENSKAMSNDDFLSLLIYYVIKCPMLHIFLNMEFVRLFRIKKKLVDSELFAITNLEAALVFIEGLTLDDLPQLLRDNLTDREKSLFAVPISRKVKLPELGRHEIDIEKDAELTKRIEVSRTASYEGFRSVFDSSLRNIIDRIRAYPISNGTESSPWINTDLKKEVPTQLSSFKQAPISNYTPSIPENWKQFKDYAFEDLTISNLREIFEIYKEMVDEN